MAGATRARASTAATAKGDEETRARIELMREAAVVAREFAAANAEVTASVRDLQRALDNLARPTAVVNAGLAAMGLAAVMTEAAAAEGTSL